MYKNNFNKLLFVGIFTIVLGMAVLVPSKQTSALYNGAKIIDNSILLNSSSMSLVGIQSFLQSKNSGLATKSFMFDCGDQNSKEREWYSAVGAPCDKTVPAADIIYYAALIYGINPQAILATLQKEQSLITSPNPTDWQINQAMGYGCPTTGGCGSSNFFYQIDSGVWVLRYHYERANGNMNWWRPSTSWVCGVEKDFYKPNLYPGQDVRFYDEDGVHYRTYRIENAATSSFYCYTPHAYNNPQGLYGRNPYGTTGRYYSGSYNFVQFYEQWFGPTTKPPIPDCPTGTAACVWGFINEDNGRSFYTSSVSERNAVYIQNFTYTGVAFFSRKNAVPGSIPLYRLYNTASNYHFWTTNITERDYLVGSGDWRGEGIAVHVDPLGSNTGTTVKRLYTQNGNGRHVYTANTSEISRLLKNGYVDEGNVFKSTSPIASPPIPPVNKENVYRFNLSGRHFFTTSIQERDSLVVRGHNYEGIGWQSPSLTATNKTPIYRLYSLKTGKHFWTSSTQERNKILSWGDWRDEGIAMHADSAGEVPIYRFYNTRSGAHIFTVSEAERQAIIKYSDWRFEGVAWRI